MPRRKCVPGWIDIEMNEFKKVLKEKIEEKGDMSFISSHEIDGAIDEELREWKDEVRSNDKDKQVKELSDIMVAAFWGIVSIRQAGTEW